MTLTKDQRKKIIEILQTGFELYEQVSEVLKDNNDFIDNWVDTLVELINVNKVKIEDEYVSLYCENCGNTKPEHFISHKDWTKDGKVQFVWCECLKCKSTIWSKK